MKNKLNIWIINHHAIPPRYGNLVRHYYFSKYFSKLGHKVRIITSSQIHNSNINLIENNELYLEKSIDDVHYTFVRTCRYKGNGIKRIYSMVQFSHNVMKTCQKLLESGDIPDLIYASSPEIFSAFYSVRFAKQHDIPKIVEIRDLWPESIVSFTKFSNKNIIIKMLYQLEKWIYKNSDEIVFTMEGGKQYILDKGWEKEVDLGKIYNINNGVDLTLYNKNRLAYKLDDSDLSNNNTIKIIYAGSIRTANNIEFILEVADKFLTKRPQVQFLIYGDGTDKTRLERLVNEKQLSNVHFKGKIKNEYIPYVLSKADYTLLHYKSTDVLKYGGSQNKLFDYLAAGKPVISTVKMNYSLIKRYACGFEAEIETIDEIVNLIERAIKLPKKQYDIMARNALKAVSFYDYDKLSQSLLDLICTAINKKS